MKKINSAIKETKYFFLDTPIPRIKFYIRKAEYKCLSAIFKLRLNSVHPKFVNKEHYISICAIFKNEAPYLKEWIEYHKIIGVDHFYLYNNFSEDDFFPILQPYIDEGIVTLTEWPIKQGQMLAYDDCIDRFSDKTNWISFIDLDEFIVPNEDYKLGKIISRFEARPVVIAYWRYFGTSGHVNRNLNGLVIEDFYVCGKKYANIGKLFFNTSYGWAKTDKHNKHMHSRWAEYGGKMLPPVNFFDKISWGGGRQGIVGLPSCPNKSLCYPFIQ